VGDAWFAVRQQLKSTPWCIEEVCFAENVYMSTPKYNKKVRMTSAEALSILGREKPVFLEGLSQAEVEMVVANASIRRYAANAVITNEAAGANHLFLLLEGVGRGYALTSRGEKIGLGWFPAGSIMGWASLVSQRMEYIVSFEAVKSSSALVWDRVTIQSFAATLPRLLENAMLMAYHYVVVYRNLHLAALCDSAPQRLAQVLVQLAKGMGHKVDHGQEDQPHQCSGRRAQRPDRSDR
jgi:CRP/FNR family transcriptional regulator, nitrogen oxide reductase regulator